MSGAAFVEGRPFCVPVSIAAFGRDFGVVLGPLLGVFHDLVRGQDVTGLLLVGGRGEHDPVHAPIRGQQGTTGVSGTHHGAYLVDFPAHLTLVVEVGPLSHLLGPDTRWNGREATVTGEPGHDRVIALGGLVVELQGFQFQAAYVEHREVLYGVEQDQCGLDLVPVTRDHTQVVGDPGDHVRVRHDVLR